MSKVRVRFAPSPTGFVHIGSLRTALYNYLFARKNNGVCILRIEDTDQNRFVEGAIENLFETMEWAGIEFDESIHNEGAKGPYQQSKRLAIYKKYAEELIDKDKAYPCFATPAELEQIREEQLAKGLDPKYDGRYREYSKSKARERMKNEKYAIRMKVPTQGETIINDIIRGQVHFQHENLEDQVILKSDGYPTYHLANIVDDHLMGITHVIRGEEWLPSTPKHILLYNFFGWQLPKFAHLPLLLNADRSKLSKRQGDVAVEDYRKKGYLPEALINFVALLGWNPAEDDREIFSMDELIEAFSLDKVNKAGAIFDVTKLNWMNGQYIRSISEEKSVEYFTPYLKEAGVDVSDAAKTSKIIQALKKRVEKADEVAEIVEIFTKNSFEIKDEQALEILSPDTAKQVLLSLFDKVSKMDTLNSDLFPLVMKEIQNETAIKGPLLWKPVRVALTGEVSGPDLPLVIDVFGKDKVCEVLTKVLNIKQ